VNDPIDAAIARHRDQPGPLLLVLHDIQQALGYVPPAAVPHIATALQLSRAEVHGVISFYHYFRDRPPGARTIRLCRAEACQAGNGDALAGHAEKRLGIGFGETTADGRHSLEAVYCLGNCACGPSLLIGEELHGRVTPERFDELLDGAEPGP
jgi:formate dehydrogenase subunit gamma